MPAEPDYILDLAGLNLTPNPPQPSGQALRGRPWLAVQWRCCSVYSRVYRHPSQPWYDAKCPRCGRSVRIAVDATQGISARFFEAG